ncbi:MAG: glycosyltransferase [Pseudomonadota bacterium]
MQNTSSDPVTILIPARNEAATIARVIDRFSGLPWASEVLVVDNGSEDGTGAAARSAGARVVHEDRPGMGEAVRTGLAAARTPWVMKVDADLDRFDIAKFSAMEAARGPHVGLVKGDWTDPDDDMPMTRLLIRPAIAHLAPALSGLRAPNSGIYLVDRRWIAHHEIVGTYAADLDVMLRVSAAGADVIEVDIGQIAHDTRSPSHYGAMATTIMGFFLERQPLEMTTQLVVAAPDADMIAPEALAFFIARARGGARVSLFLNDPDTGRGRALTATMKPFPTFRIHPLRDLRAQCPGAATGATRIFAPYPVASQCDITRGVLSVQSGLRQGGDDAFALWLLPPPDRQGVVQHFTADTVFDAGSGVDLCRQVLAAGQDTTLTDAAACGDHAVFQSYASLPDALKLGLLGVETETQGVAADPDVTGKPA